MVSLDRFPHKVRKALLPLCLWAFLDAADGSYFAGVFRALEVDLGLTMENLSKMQGSVCLAVMIWVPFWGAVIDHKVFSRKALLVLSAFGWGITSIGMGASQTFNVMLFLRFMNTGFLCSGLPIGQSIVTSIAAPSLRGACFSICAMFAGIGAVVSTKISTNISEEVIYGYAGWRVGLFTIGGISVAFSALLALVMQEPSADPAVKQEEWSKSSIRDVMVFLSSSVTQSCGSYSFWLIVLQCGLWQIVLQVQPYMAMWLQYSGYSDSVVGTLTSCWRIGDMVGGAMGGFFGDAFCEWNSLHGRQRYGQMVCFAALPLLTFVFGPTHVGRLAFLHIAVLLFGLGVFNSSWGTGVNRPVLTQVVAKSHVASTMAWKLSFESVFGFLFGPSIVVGLTTHFGFRHSDQKVSEMSESFKAQNAAALGNLILVVSLSAFFAMVLIYKAMEFTFNWDLQKQGESVTKDEKESGKMDEDEILRKHVLGVKRYV